MKGFKWQALIYILERRNILADLWGADSTYQIKRGTLGAQSGALWWPRGGGWEEGREAQEGGIYIYIYTHTHGWLTLLYERNQHNIAKWFSPNQKINYKKGMGTESTVQTLS